MSLFTKVSVLTGAAASLALLGGSYLIFSVTRTILEESIVDRQADVAEQMMSGIDRLLYERYRDVRHIAEEGDLEDVLSDGGNMVPVDTEIKEFAFLSGPWDTFSLVNASGTVISSSDRSLVGTSVRDRAEYTPAYERALVTEAYYSDVILSRDTSPPTVVFSAPVQGHDLPGDPVLGMIVGSLSWSSINDIVNDLPQDRHVELFSKNEILIASNQKDEKSLYVRHESLVPVLEKVDAEPVSLTFFNTENNVSAVVTAVPSKGYSIYKGNDWILSVETPTTIAFGSAVKTAFNVTMLLVPIVCIPAALFLFVIARFFMRRVRALTRVAEAIASGDLTQRVPPTFRDEIGELGTAFNMMVERLGQHAVSLESEVEKRTQELQRFKLAVEHASQHIIMTDVDGTITYANTSAEQLTGYSRAEMIGKRPSLWGGQMPKEFYEDMWRTIKEEKKTFAGELQNKRKNGELYWASSIVSPVVDAHGEVQFFVGIESDISKQKALDKSLLEQREAVERIVVDRTRELKDERARLVASINSIPLGFILADLEHRIILKNPALEEILDMSKNPGTIEEVSNSFGIAGVNDVKFNLAESCRECVVLKQTLEIKEVAYGQKFLRVLCAPISTNEDREHAAGSGDIIGYVILIEDITEAKILERSRDEFFAVASHELRTPLTAIRGNAKMLLDMYADKIVDKDMVEMLTDISTSSVRLIDIVNDFLEVSRLEQGRIQINKEEFDVIDVIEKVMRDLMPVAVKKGISLSYPTEGKSLPHLFSDKNRVEQILVNLIGNAVKFTKTGGVTVEVEPQGNFLRIRIQDTGTGISMQNQNLLFRKFLQAGEQMLARDVTQGTGLGLYICRQIISRLGGTIGIEKSELGKGSSFAFTVPTIGLK